MKRVIGCAVVCLFLAAMVSAQAWADEGQLIKVFVQDASGRLSFVDAVQHSDGQIDVVLSGACNGGSCESGTGHVLDCPKTGGPNCKSDEVCTCQCFKNTTTGTWYSKNVCVKE